jgi:hypothetical protein
MNAEIGWLQAQGERGAVGWDLRSLLQLYWPQILFVAVILVLIFVLLPRKRQGPR